MIFLFNVQLRNKYDDDDDDILAGSKEILSVHHFTVLVILPMRYAPAFSSFSQFAK